MHNVIKKRLILTNFSAQKKNCFMQDIERLKVYFFFFALILNYFVSAHPSIKH